MDKRRRTGGGRFRPKDRHVYFMAGSLDTVEEAATLHDSILVPVNELFDDASAERVERLIDSGADVLLDSGVFTLAMQTGDRLGISHDKALAMKPEQVDGFDRLADRYVELVRAWGDRLWGYIELDFGGSEGKIKTRTWLEGIGLRPIPVYHPFSDGIDYFDMLCDRYDRLCLGNIVQSSVGTRERLLHTALSRRGDRPVWMHALGLSLHQMANALPVESCDSSSWMESIRWVQGYRERTALQNFGEIPVDFRYAKGDGPGRLKATRMAAYGVGCYERNWQQLTREYDAF